MSFNFSINRTNSLSNYDSKMECTTSSSTSNLKIPKKRKREEKEDRKVEESILSHKNNGIVEKINKIVQRVSWHINPQYGSFALQHSKKNCSPREIFERQVERIVEAKDFCKDPESYLEKAHAFTLAELPWDNDIFRKAHYQSAFVKESIAGIKKDTIFFIASNLIYESQDVEIQAERMRRMTKVFPKTLAEKINLLAPLQKNLEILNQEYKAYYSVSLVPEFF